MKRVLSIMAWLAFGVVAVNAQISVITDDDFLQRDTCDIIKYVVNYDMEFVDDISKTPYEYKKDRMLLQIGERATLFYSYDKYLADSTNLEVLKRNGTEYVGSNGASWLLYKNYPKEKHYSYLDKIIRDRYVCHEPVEEPDWQLVADTTAIIKEHPCVLATADYLGRKWYAWYAEDIPLSEGPWKLCGLPGLVLRAYDSENQYRFELSGIRNGRPGEVITYIGNKHETIDRKTLNQIYKRYFSDPVGFIVNSDPNVKVTVTDDKGNKLDKMPGIPYNPIER
ncbi:MAG: GLPGLI family protein [Prevotella sp.]|uniref:GLPGLI family protein n=1 Tax=Prevotella sp. TaxID=59823 RepID=UPI002A279ECA|nr:GLPGLI family protein [Prevotella sp.]MDD7318548.1 GLPGLI family protein [Prevotellaceae bacterium]MDY4020349.1 GLPGLI family protein [Prevotella sp.]